MQSLQMASLAAETTGGEILVAFWPKHDLRSGLRMPDLPWGGMPPDPPSLLTHTHALIRHYNGSISFLALAPDQTIFP